VHVCCPGILISVFLETLAMLIGCFSVSKFLGNPFGNATKLIPKLNIAEFSSLTRGTIIARLQSSVRGIGQF